MRNSENALIRKNVEFYRWRGGLFVECLAWFSSYFGRFLAYSG